MTENSNWTIGKLLRKSREEQGLSISQLCTGLCSIATMTRIETNERDIEIFLAFRLFQRLGLSPDKFDIYVNPDEFEQYEQQTFIENLFAEGNYYAVKEHIQNYKTKWNKLFSENSLQRQFIESVEGRLSVLEGDFEKSIRLLEDAIQITVPNYTQAWHKLSIVGESEMKLMDYLADAYDGAGQKQEALNIRKKIIYYIDKRGFKKEQVVRLYMDIICKIVPELYEAEMYKECIKLCEQGLDILSNKKRLYHWPDVLYWLGKSLETLYANEGLERQRIIDIYQQAYYIYDLFKNKEMSDKIWHYLKETYEWECIR